MHPQLAIPRVPGDAGSDEGGTRRVCTLVLTDLVDSTGLIQARGDARAAEIFRLVDRVARDLLTELDGQEIDRTDGHLVLFDLPIAGVEYAVTLHGRLDGLAHDLGTPLSCRAAVHVGQIIVRANAPEDVAHGAKPLEIEGLAKPATARLLSLALPGQTLLGSTAYELARRATVGQPAFDRYVWASYGDYRFQGLEETFAVHEVGVAGRAPLHAPPDSDKARRSTTPEPAPATTRRPRVPWLLLVPLAVVIPAFYMTRGFPSSQPPTPPARFVVDPPGIRVSAEGVCLSSGLAISHDGRTVAFTATDATGRELGVVVRPLDLLEVRPAHFDWIRPTYDQPFPFNSRDPFFSPDDRWLGFLQGFTSGKVRVAGGSATALEGLQQFDLGEKDEWMNKHYPQRGAAARNGGYRKGAVWTSYGLVVSPGTRSGLVDMPFSDGPAVVITSPDPASQRWPDLLPDGRHALVSVMPRLIDAPAFERNTFDDGEIAVVDLERGGAPEVVWTGGYYPRYSPSGHIVYARHGSLMAVPFDAERRAVTGPAAVVLRDVTMSPENGAAAFAISANGTLVYVPGRPCDVETELVWTSSDGTQEAVDLPAGDYTHPSLSPDATRVAVVVRGIIDTLYVLQVESGTLTHVTFRVNAISSVWDHDGDHLFVAFEDQDGTGIERVRADGMDAGTPQILYRIPQGPYLELNNLVAVAGEPTLVATVQKHVVLFSVGAETKATRVDALPLFEFDPAASPDGRCLAYASMTSGMGGTSEVYVRPLTGGGGRTQVSVGGGAQPLWSRDGNWLLYTPADAETDPSRRRVGVPVHNRDCLTMTTGTPIPMAAPPGERVLEIRKVEPPVEDQDLHVVAIQGWADTLAASESIAAQSTAAP